MAAAIKGDKENLLDRALGVYLFIYSPVIQEIDPIPNYNSLTTSQHVLNSAL